VTDTGHSQFVDFYRNNLPTVYGYLLRLCGGDRGLAEDLTQDTWLALARELAAGRTERADIRWLLTVARSRFLDQLRKSRRETRKLSAVGVAPDASFEPDRAEVIEFVERLAPPHRAVLMLRYVDDLPVPKIAALIDRNLAATNSLLARARAELREQVRRS